MVELERAPDAQPLPFPDHLLEALALDVLEDDVGAPVDLAAIDHRDEVRVVELGDRARLAPEALDDIARR